jgi:hypothetical protein
MASRCGDPSSRVRTEFHARLGVRGRLQRFRGCFNDAISHFEEVTLFGLDRRIAGALLGPRSRRCRSGATRRYPAVHVVGTNGKTSTTLMTAALLHAEGLSRRRLHLATRARLGRADPDRRRAGGHRAGARANRSTCHRRNSVRGADGRSARRVRALSGVDAAVVEAGLGGRLRRDERARRARWSC